MALTLKQLERFIRIRNKSEFNSNLQFHIDASECGFKPKELGEVTKHEDGTYSWNTPFGVLVEWSGQLILMAPDEDQEAQAMNGQNLIRRKMATALGRAFSL